MRAIIVEDNLLIALDAEDYLRDAGIDLRIAANVAEAEAICADADVAVIDVRLPDGSGYELARRLAALGKRIVFTTGEQASECPPDLEHWPFLSKPYSPEELRGALGKMKADAAVVERSTGEPVIRPRPGEQSA